MAILCKNLQQNLQNLQKKLQKMREKMFKVNFPGTRFRWSANLGLTDVMITQLLIIGFAYFFFCFKDKFKLYDLIHYLSILLRTSYI